MSCGVPADDSYPLCGTQDASWIRCIRSLEISQVANAQNGQSFKAFKSDWTKLDGKGRNVSTSGYSALVRGHHLRPLGLPRLLGCYYLFFGLTC